MHLINTSYARWYNHKKERVGYVFRDRYKVEEITDLHHLYSCVKYIHNNPVKAEIIEKPEDYKHSSYRDYLNNSGICNSELMEILQLSRTDIDNIFLNQSICNSNDLYSIDPQQIINEFIVAKRAKSINEINNLKFKKELILLLKHKSKINYEEIANFLGTSRSTVFRIIKNG